MSKARDLADFISTGSILSDGTIESTEISGVTADATEINKLDGLTADTTELNTLDGVTATTAELNKLAGTTATTSDFDKLSNVTASAIELNYMTGATSSIQSQLDNISVTSGSLTKSFTSGESATITLAQSITPAPVVSVTKEVAQTGQSSKGAWDVNATASNYDLHNTAYATTLTPSSTGYDLANASDDSNNFSYGGTDNYMQKVAFSTDGTKFYLTGNTNAYIYQYNLTTAWDLSTASYSNNYFDFSTVAAGVDISMISFKPDGTKMYAGSYGNDYLYEFNLSTAWDITTASNPQNQDIYIGTTVAVGIGMWFKPDGTSFYVLDNSQGKVVRYDLSTAWDITTATVAQAYYPTQAQVGGTFRQIQFTADGTKFYLLCDDSSVETIVEYSLTTAWDVSTATRTNSDFNYLSAVGSNVPGFYIKQDDGTKIFVMNNTTSPSKLMTFSIASESLVLGTGSFASADVGKRIQGNGGDVILTSTAGAYSTTGGSDFTDTSTIASGSWTMHGLKSAGAVSGLTLTKGVLDGTAGSGVSTLDFFGDGSGVSTLVLDSGLADLNTANTWQGSFNGASAPVKWGTKSLHIPDGNTAYYGAVYGLDLSANNNSYTMSCWFYLATIRTGINAVMAMTSGTGTSGSATLGQGMITVSNGVFGKGTTSGTNLETDYNSGQTISPTTWYHGVATYDGATDVYKMYLDGSLVLTVTDASTKGSHPPDLNDPTNVNILLGHEPDSFGPFGGFSGSQNIAGYIDQVRIFDKALSADEVSSVYAETPFDNIVSTSQYHIGVTNSAGQISSEFWLDINSMTADQSLGDGEAYYAVSTDDRTTWSVAKGSDGVRPIVRDNAGTWQYNSQESSTTVGYNLSGGTYDNVSLNTVTTNRTVKLGNNGTKLYAIQNNGYIYQWTLSTANDLSTATFDHSFNQQSQDADPKDVHFKSDGTKMYLMGDQNNTIYQYSLSTAWDISTASYDSVQFGVTSQATSTFGLTFKPDGTKMYMSGDNGRGTFEYTLSTAWDLSTASYTGNSINTGSQDGNAIKVTFKPDGAKMYMVGFTNDRAYQYTLSTAWDLSTATYDSVYLQLTAGVPYALEYSSDGTKLFVAYADANGTIEQWSTGLTTATYSTSTTWTDATTNDEFYALQQALGATSVNRMDKTQLDAVADGSHFTLGNTLDLMIALKQDTASASLPTSDGVTINYDAEALNQGAVLGTDYDFDFPANNKVRITSNAAQNLKIRVV
jgi:hypothetical protein